MYIYIYTLKITVSKKQDAINRQDEYHHYVSVILNQNFLTFARRKLSSLRSATAYRRRLYFAVLSRLITAAKMYRSPFSTRCSRISFPRFDSIPSIWKEEETSFLSLEARNRRFVRKYKRGVSLSIRFENHPFKYGITLRCFSLGMYSNIFLSLSLSCH